MPMRSARRKHHTGSERAEESAEIARRAEAGALLDRRLRDSRAPPPERGARALDDAGRRLASSFMRDLAAIYGVDAWSLASFRRAYVEGALASWKPGTTARMREERLRVESPGCPLEAEAARDPAACRACQVFHAHAAQIALECDFKGVTFHALATEGAPACLFSFEVTPEAAQRERLDELL